MSYIINKSNGAKLVTIEDGSINVSVCDLSLVGKNYAGYGESIATNFVKLLENFSNSKQPPKPITGQIWYDSTNRKIKFYNGAEFKPVPSLQSSTDYPTDQYKGDLHYNETEGKLYYYDGTGYVLIGPQLTGKSAINTVTPVLLQEANGQVHYVLQHQIQDQFVETDLKDVVIASRAQFIPTSGDYSDYPVIKRGLTLPGTNSFGVSYSSENLEGYLLWGTASDSIRLNGKEASDFVTYESPIFTAQVQVNNVSGVNIAQNQLRLFSNVNGAQVTSSLYRISLNVTDTNQEIINVVNVDASDNPALLASRTLGTLVNIGSASNPFNIIYGREFNTVGADLAENYLADAQYEPGTVLRLGGTAEVTICASYEHEGIAGIVSTQPGYLLNRDLANGVAIALKGRVPCKVKGPVKKGDVLVSSNIPGHAEVRKYGHRTNPMAVLGKALQDFEGETGVIEVMVY